MLAGCILLCGTALGASGLVCSLSSPQATISVAAIIAAAINLDLATYASVF